MYFFLLFNDWNYVWFDESLALMDRLKKAIAKIRKKNIACIYITHVVYLLFMLPSRMTAYYMSSTLLFLPSAWVDLGPLQNLRWSTL